MNEPGRVNGIQREQHIACSDLGPQQPKGLLGKLVFELQ
jgi:hypothetical protein